MTTTRAEGSHQPLALASVHLCWYSPHQRQNTAKRLTTLGELGKHALDGGDMTRTLDEMAPETPWDEITDIAHFEPRTIERNASQSRTPDRIGSSPASCAPPVVSRCVFVEPGHYAGRVMDPPSRTR